MQTPIHGQRFSCNGPRCHEKALAEGKARPDGWLEIKGQADFHSEACLAGWVKELGVEFKEGLGIHTTTVGSVLRRVDAADRAIG